MLMSLEKMNDWGHLLFKTAFYALHYISWIFMYGGDATDKKINYFLANATCTTYSNIRMGDFL